MFVWRGCQRIKNRAESTGWHKQSHVWVNMTYKENSKLPGSCTLCTCVHRSMHAHMLKTQICRHRGFALSLIDKCAPVTVTSKRRAPVKWRHEVNSRCALNQRILQRASVYVIDVNKCDVSWQVRAACQSQQSIQTSTFACFWDKIKVSGHIVLKLPI